MQRIGDEMNIVLFFGEMGAGKTYWAKEYQTEHPQLWFIEGDELVPVDMQAYVKKFKLPTKDMVERLVLRIANLPALTPVDSQCKGFVICQALYRNGHREFLLNHWKRLGYNVQAVWIRVPFWQNIRQLLKRPQGWKWLAYWLLNKPFFQKPSHPYLELYELPPF